MTARDYLEVGRAPNGAMLIRTRLLHALGRLCGIQFYIGGWPYGAAYRGAINNVRAADCAPMDQLVGG